MKKTDMHIHTRVYDTKKTADFLNHLKEKGVEKVSFQTVATSKDYSNYENLFALWVKDFYKDMDICVNGSLHEWGPFLEIPYEDQVKWLYDAGCEGMKFLHMKPTIRKQTGKGLNHPSYDKALSFMEEKGMFALIHSKDPRSFWHQDQMLPMQVEKGWCYEGKGFISFEDAHRETLEMLDKHPNLKTILAHLFYVSDDIEEAARVLDTYPNVYFDITPGVEIFENFAKDIPAWREFFIKYQDRIMFGTDADETFDTETVDDLYALAEGALFSDNPSYVAHCYVDLKVGGLNLPKEVVQKIYRTNFETFTGGKVNKPNLSLMKEGAKYAYETLSKYPEYKTDAKLFGDFVNRI